MTQLTINVELRLNPTIGTEALDMFNRFLRVKRLPSRVTLSASVVSFSFTEIIFAAYFSRQT